MAFGPFEGFVNPGLAIGASLAAVPLVIHLLNRQRHKPMPWAAMRFVLAAYKKTRRRARFENLILLLLRMAAVALLALAISRPFVGKENPLAGLTENRRDVVLVLDGSASTGWRESVRSVFESIVARAREITLALKSSRGDRVRVLFAAGTPRLLSWRSPEEALDVLSTLREPSDEPLDLAAALSEVAGYAEQDAAGGAQGSLEVRLLSDLQRRNFTPELEHGAAASSTESKNDARLFEALDRLRKLGLKVQVENLGPADEHPANLAVTDVDVQSSDVAVDVPMDVSVGVSNFASTPRSGVRIALEVDGERRPSKSVDVPARGKARESFPIVFHQPGAHSLVARLESDRLAIDDVRPAVIAVPPALRVLLVDGEPSTEVADDEVGYLAAVLSPIDDAGVGASPFDTHVVEASALRDASLDLGNFDVIWLANVEALSDSVVDRLEKRVAAGAGLVVSCGALLQTDVYDRRLFKADGSGLLPAELGRRVAVSSRRDSYFRAHEFDLRHPALAFFADERWKPLFSEVPIYEFLSARPLESARVLARLDDESKSPLLVEKSFDRGIVMLWTTTIDTAWTRLPESPRTLVPLVHELVRYAGRPHTPSRNVPVGARFVLDVPFFARNPVLVRPDGSRAPIAGEVQSSAPGVWTLPAVTDTAKAGLYKLEFDSEAPQSFAVQFDTSESDLEKISPNELAALHPALVPVSSIESDHAHDDQPKAPQGELWRWIAMACLAALTFETLWSAWIGRARSVRG